MNRSQRERVVIRNLGDFDMAMERIEVEVLQQAAGHTGLNLNAVLPKHGSSNYGNRIRRKVSSAQYYLLSGSASRRDYD